MAHQPGLSGVPLPRDEFVAITLKPPEPGNDARPVQGNVPASGHVTLFDGPASGAAAPKPQFVALPLGLFMYDAQITPDGDASFSLYATGLSRGLATGPMNASI